MISSDKQLETSIDSKHLKSIILKKLLKHMVHSEILNVAKIIGSDWDFENPNLV
tara:strand:+ start:171 stop:332 length:162 start_codon:yes stop_codon:yes gene_type:complete